MTVEYHTEPGHRISTPPSECALCKRDRRATEQYVRRDQCPRNPCRWPEAHTHWLHDLETA